MKGVMGMFWALGALTAFLMYLVAVAKVKNLLIALLCAFSWLAMAFWSILAVDSPFGDLTLGYNVIIVTIFVAMAFTPIILHMQVEVVKEQQGIRWAESMNKKQLAQLRKTPSVYDQHRTMLAERIARGRSRAKRR